MFLIGWSCLQRVDQKDWSVCVKYHDYNKCWFKLCVGHLVLESPFGQKIVRVCHWYLWKTSWSRVLAIDPDWLQRCDVAMQLELARSSGPSQIGGRAIALFQNRSRTVYHRCPHPSSSMHRLLLAEEMGRSRGQGEAKAGVKIPALWRPNQTETRESKRNARNSETEPEPNQCCKLWCIDRWWPRGSLPTPILTFNKQTNQTEEKKQKKKKTKGEEKCA